MAINSSLIDNVRDLIEREVEPQNLQLAQEFNKWLSVPNYRAAFAVLIKIEKDQTIKKSEEYKIMIGRFWHEVAE